MSSGEHRGADVWDVVVIGGGPAGQNAVVEACTLGKKVLLVEEERTVGGYCVRRGTIPSKTLREAALALSGLRRRCGDAFAVAPREDLPLSSLFSRVDRVVEAHETFMGAQVGRSGATRWHGRARFASPHEVEVEGLDRRVRRVVAGKVVIATGSRPRGWSDIDHEHVLDSDSILGLGYLPRSLAVIGSGVIASEYACIFQSLGVRVQMIDSVPRPLGFLDEEIGARFQAEFRRAGGQYLANRRVESAKFDGVQNVAVRLDSGAVLEVEKVLFCKGRVANLEGLALAHAGLAATASGHLAVDRDYRTTVPHIYAVGDVVGAPGLATSAVDQGRRAARHAAGVDPGPRVDMVPVGVYTIPEIASVGMNESEARAVHGEVIVGRADFAEVARGHISANEHGLLRLVVDSEGRKILGVQIIGEGAADLVHMGQMAMVGGMDVDVFVTTIFNFPTMAEAYRVAALDVARQRR